MNFVFYIIMLIIGYLYFWKIFFIFVTGWLMKYGVHKICQAEQQGRQLSPLSLIFIHLYGTTINCMIYGLFVAWATTWATAIYSDSSPWVWFYFIFGGFVAFFTMVAPSLETSLLAMLESLVFYLIGICLFIFTPEWSSYFYYIWIGVFPLIGIISLIIFFVKAKRSTLREFSEETTEIKTYKEEAEPYNEQACKYQEINQKRPWVRWFARMCDYFIFNFMLSFIFYGIAINAPIFYWGFGMLFLWNFVEALYLTTWGTTPGKWLLGTSVRDIYGNKLTYQAALSRGFSVWARGMGLGLPIVSLVTLITSYNQLNKPLGKTPWDIEGGYVVQHTKLNPLGVIAVIGVFIFASPYI